MNPSLRLTTSQVLFLAVCFAAWLLFALLVPQSNSIDVYLFRDAALSWVQGHGFKTASFEKSTSFTPLLYSNYTPLSIWVFIPFAKVFGGTWRASSVFTVVLASVGSLAALSAGLRLAVAPFQRWLLVLLVGLALPAGFLTAEADRPEELSFVLLVLLLWLLSRRLQTPGVFVLQGLAAGLAFLSEPFAGVLAVALIAGTVAARALAAAPRSDSHFNLGRALRIAGIQGAVTALCFALPIAVTVLGFEHEDAGALGRFQAQAKYAGTQRPINYGMSADHNMVEAYAAKDSLPAKLHAGIGGQLSGPLTILQLLTFAAAAVLGTLLALSYGANLRASWPVWAMLVLAIAFPLFAFPLQGNYRILGTGLLPVALALGWAGFTPTAGRRFLLWAWIAVQAGFALPSQALQTLIRTETRRSYLAAVEQARITGAYLQAHGLGDAVLVVPASDYFIYKPAHWNLYNGNYYATAEGTAQIGGMVECKNSSKDFSPTATPPHLPGDWMLLSHNAEPVAISLAGHRLMRRNWSLGCDVYVRKP